MSSLTLRTAALDFLDALRAEYPTVTAFNLSYDTFYPDGQRFDIRLRLDVDLEKINVTFVRSE